MKENESFYLRMIQRHFHEKIRKTGTYKNVHQRETKNKNPEN